MYVHIYEGIYAYIQIQIVMRMYVEMNALDLRSQGLQCTLRSPTSRDHHSEQSRGGIRASIKVPQYPLHSFGE